MKNGKTESIILVADPADEIDEVWNEARENALEGGLMALVAIGVTSLLVGRAVRPLGVAGATLSKLEAVIIPRGLKATDLRRSVI